MILNQLARPLNVLPEPCRGCVDPECNNCATARLRDCCQTCRSSDPWGCDTCPHNEPAAPTPVEVDTRGTVCIRPGCNSIDFEQVHFASGVVRCRQCGILMYRPASPAPIVLPEGWTIRHG